MNFPKPRKEGPALNIKGFLEKICVMSVLGLIAVVFLGEIIQTELLTIIQIILLILLLTSGIILARGIALYFSQIGRASCRVRV